MTKSEFSEKVENIFCSGNERCYECPFFQHEPATHIDPSWSECLVKEPLDCPALEDFIDGNGI